MTGLSDRTFTAPLILIVSWRKAKVEEEKKYI